LARRTRSSPGHGKAVVGAYLVGSRGNVLTRTFSGRDGDYYAHARRFRHRIRHAFASTNILPERLMPF
jgi:hypothetical protein